MTTITEIEEGEQPSGAPGIYTVKGTKLWGVAPMASGDQECIPYQWARDFPELEGFVARFPLHWKLDDIHEAWFGGTFEVGAVYWCRWTPPAEGPT